MAAGSMIAMAWSRSNTSGETFLNLMPTVPASGAVTSATLATAGSMLKPRSLSAAFSKFLTTSAATSSFPLWNFTPLRSMSVTDCPSGATVHFSASPGSGLRFWS
jgi:hypothetical protein